MTPNQRHTFIIHFANGFISPAIQIEPDAPAQAVVDTFGLITPRPAIFIIGGASAMSEEDMERTRQIIHEGIIPFAEQYNCTVIDGGTEAGVMKMMGEGRYQRNAKFPLIGVAPSELVGYPTRDNPNGQATLEAGHSHFVLVKSDQWGQESRMIVNLTLAVAAQQKPMLGILINGGKIAEQDIYLATTYQNPRIPILVIDGSGRLADTVSTAVKTGQTNSGIIQAIVKGGDIRLISIKAGPQAMFERLVNHFVHGKSY